MRIALTTLAHMAAATVAAALVSVVALASISQVDWPAFPSSNQLHALTTVGQVGCLIGLIAAGLAWRRGRTWIARLGATVFLSAFAVVTLGMPLGATKLYLFGISVDQQFRTEYLTRLTDTAALRDMTYFGLPPFYPPGWFWLGGRIAALTGTPGWEIYKPWAITSIAIAVAVAMVLWSQLVRFEYALALSASTAAVTLAFSSPEPYSAVITVLIPPVLVLAWSGLRAARHGRGWSAAVAVGVFLGFAATFYTLLLAYAAFTVTVMALAAAVVGRSIAPIIRLALTAVIAVAIAAITWLPFLLRAVDSPISDAGSPQHYLPADGAVLNFPMLVPSLLGGLCMLGTLWLVWRARVVHATALLIGVLALYAWSILSMLTTLAGTTLLSFRLQPTLTVLLSAAGVFGFVEIARWAAARWSRNAIGAATAIGLIGAIGFSQDIPNVLRPDITVAYTDTDGDGQRGDRRPPGAEKFYRRIDDAIQQATGRPRAETVVMTTDYSFLSFFPYYGFQGLTSHYANPLAQFDKRAAAIESWADLTSSDDFAAALDALPFKAPTVFLMRRGGAAGSSESFTLRLAEDVYPNQPNVRRYTVELPAALFASPNFKVSTIGPFVLAIRS